MTKNINDDDQSPQHVTVLAPVRNEADSIDAFVGRIHHALEPTAVSWDVVFADDSDDSTPELIQTLAADGAPLTCVHRAPPDRVASIAGALQNALGSVKGPYVVVIDSDLQHPPEVVAPMLEPLLNGEANITVGTRYAGGGSAAGLGSRWRRFASVFAGTLIKLALPHLWHCSDLSSGLFGFDLREVDPNEIDTEGFKVLTEIILASDPNTITEIPYVFEVRDEGVSKARIRDGVVLVRQLVHQRRRCNRWRPIDVQISDMAPIHVPLDSRVGVGTNA